MELYNKKTLSNGDEYNAAEALIAQYMYRNDAEAESILDKLFSLMSEYEERASAPPENYEELDFEDPDEGLTDWQ